MGTRRDFVKTGLIAGGGLVLSFTLPDFLTKVSGQLYSKPFSPNAFLRISEDNQIAVILSKVEMGQGVWTTLPMLIAEELDCNLSQIKVEHSPAGKEYFHTFIPGQVTVGSSSTISEFDRYRMAGATAREMLVQAAANKLGVSASLCRTENGHVICGNHLLSYGEVCNDAAKLSVPEVKLRQPKEWKLIGKSQKRLDAADKINGKAVYGIDTSGEDLLTALLLRPPVFGSKVKSFDATKAKAIKGVMEIVQIPNSVAVLADNFWSAKLGRDALTVNWEYPADWLKDSQQQRQNYQKLAHTKGEATQQKGDVSSGFSKAAKTIDAEYWLPYLAHAPMEPLNCTVKIHHDGCDIWTGTQMPMVEQAAAAKVLNLQPEQVKIHTPYLGGGFGRRGSLNADWVVEAVQVAKASGKFIKLVWTREDDIRGGFYRPAYLHAVKVGLNAEGLPVVWQHRVVGQGVFKNTFVIPDPKAIDFSSVEGVKDSPYLEHVPDHSVELHTTTLNVPVLPWRSVGKSHTCFVMESMIDELATLAKKDSVEYRRILLQHKPRYLSVLNLVAQKADWGKPLLAGTGRGVAVYEGNGSYVAYVVEASFSKKKLKVHQVWCAFDCGLAVNPDGVRAQIESSIVFGLSAALYGEITFKNGQVQQSNFHDYPVLRMTEMPLIDIYILTGDGKLGGAGEPGVPPIAPALTNAIFNATGKRIRNLPIRIEDLG
ncbi:MAG TPA: xanthine dehydrogenase family protein molybdopterin-binding subunit [Chitinophagaceae bacterium]|nr:xanthine dehydrogenase family protein molybdopterin-binding subunit [Chitinophagaceae bacterium]